MKADKAVKTLFTSTNGGRAAPPAWIKQTRPRPPVGPPPGWPSCAPEPRSDGLIQLQALEVRFAHDAQSECFGKASAREGGSSSSRSKSSNAGGSILQLAAELLSGATLASAVPEFTVCRHENLWYCRSGNRRLAAFRLAASFDSHRFGVLQVRAVATDDIFLYGAGSKRAKLSTHKNDLPGHPCKGHWLRIRETWEPVGGGFISSRDEDYGADLLMLLTQPCNRPSKPPVLEERILSPLRDDGLRGFEQHRSSRHDRDRALATGAELQALQAQDAWWQEWEQRANSFGAHMPDNDRFGTAARPARGG